MPCHPTFNEREVAKGAKLYVAREATPGTYVRVAGVVSISGPNATREKIDGSELDPQPDTIPEGLCEENYFYKQQFPGEKEYAEMSVVLNMKWTQYQTLLDIYDDDELAYFKILLRSGNGYYFRSFVVSLDKNFETNKLVQVTMGVQPVTGISHITATTTTSTTTSA